MWQSAVVAGMNRWFSLRLYTTGNCRMVSRLFGRAYDRVCCQAVSQIPFQGSINRCSIDLFSANKSQYRIFSRDIIPSASLGLVIYFVLRDFLILCSERFIGGNQ
ncbi:hypothetical protein B1R44_00270 [Serratia marcescens]|nr:hypothetical protein B1R44_00270 [Serratia marcescens]